MLTTSNWLLYRYYYYLIIIKLKCIRIKLEGSLLKRLTFIEKNAHTRNSIALWAVHMAEKSDNSILKINYKSILIVSPLALSSN